MAVAALLARHRSAVPGGGAMRGNLWRATGWQATQFAKSATPSEAESVSMWSASDTRATLLAANPTANSTIMNPPVNPIAIRYARPARTCSGDPQCA
jgi:hypothetical protein